MPLAINNPTVLVEEFKKSGEFDRLRRELLAQFQQDESYSTFKSRVEEIARQRLENDQMLKYTNESDVVLKELNQEIERYPIVERAVADVRLFSDPAFLSSMEKSLQKILRNGKKETSLSKENATTRTKVMQSNNNATLLEKPAQDGEQGNKALGQSKPTIFSTSGESAKIEPVTEASNVGNASSHSQDVEMGEL